MKSIIKVIAIIMLLATGIIETALTAAEFFKAPENKSSASTPSISKPVTLYSKFQDYIYNKSQKQDQSQSTASKNKLISKTTQPTIHELFLKNDTPQSQEIVNTINTSTPENVHTNLTNLLIISDNPQIAQELSNLKPTTKNQGVRDFAWEINESNAKKSSLQQPDKGIDLGKEQIVTDDMKNLEQRKSQAKTSLEINKVSQQSSKNSLITVNDEIKQSLQSAYKEMNMESPEIQSIIDNSTSFNEINQQFTQLLMTTADTAVSKNIEAITTILDTKSTRNKNIPELYLKNIHELYLLAHEKNFNVQDILNNPSKTYETLDDKIIGLRLSLSVATEKFKNFSQDFKENVTKLYNDAIITLQTQQETENIYQDLIQKIVDDPSLTHEEKLEKLESSRSTAEFSAQDLDLNATSKNLPAMYDNAITALTNKPKMVILAEDIQSLKLRKENLDEKNLLTNTSNSLAILAKQGSLNARTIASKISGMFKSAGVKDTNGETTRTISAQANQNKPGKNASPATTRNWMNDYIIKPASDFIAKYRTTQGATQTIEEAIQV